MKCNRRQFLYGLGSFLCLPALQNSLWAAPFPDTFNRTLMHVMLEGGPDFRHLIVPPAPGIASLPDDYSRSYWKARSTVFQIPSGDMSAARNYYQKNYDTITISGVQLGILKRAGWLKHMLENQNAAIVFNTIGTDTRDHHHAQIVWESGSPDYGPHAVSRPGWGGRLAKALGRRLVSVRHSPSLFANGPHPQKPLDHENSHVISAPDMENLAFYANPGWHEDAGYVHSQKALYRAIQHSYRSLRQQIQRTSPLRRFVDTEATKRMLGDAVRRRLYEEIHPQGVDLSHAGARRPPEFESIISGETELHRSGFARQMLNAYYAFACKNLDGFDFNVLEANYGGWDSHKLQNDPNRGIDSQFADVFGARGGLATLFQLLQRDMPESLDRLVIAVGGEFGRQLRSNGDNGTDHGRGNAMILIGKPINGGLYGEVFPDREISRMNEYNQDIEGRTGLYQVLSRLLIWAKPNHLSLQEILPMPSHELAKRVESGALGFL